MRKTLRISFDIDVVELLAAMTGTSSMKIDVFDHNGAPPVKAIGKPAKKAIKKYPMRTKNKQGKTPTRALILRHMATKGAPIQIRELIDIAVSNGNTKSATSVGLDWMKKRKWVKSLGKGYWQATELGKRQLEAQ